MIKFDFKYKNENFSIYVKKCDNIISRASGLMFKTKSKPLLFIFPNENLQAIHSFFCRTFIAIWFNNNRIVDVKIVMPWRPYIIPKEKFDKLLEIPINDSNFGVFSRRYRNL